MIIVPAIILISLRFMIKFLPASLLKYGIASSIIIIDNTKAILAKNTEMKASVGVVINWLHSAPILSIRYELERPVYYSISQAKTEWEWLGYEQTKRDINKLIDISILTRKTQ